ncbi:PSP domain-containing protein [Ditylenchus destructor]|nr:PSP domain-containing protein [Ditylenchus destructor]
MSDSDSDTPTNLNAKELQELERRRRRNKKKKVSKKANKKTKSVLPAQDSGEEDNQEVVEVSEAVVNGQPVKVPESSETSNGQTENGEAKDQKDVKEDLAVDIEYVGELPKLDPKDPNFVHFAKIFEAFKLKSVEELKREEEIRLVKREVVEDTVNRAAISEQILQDEMNQRRKEAEESGEAQKMSRRKLRLSMQPSIVDLKATTVRPDVVEWADVTSRDPFLLVELKAYRNTVTVPRHWNAKRKYLAGKRGFERPPFELPDFIKRTGIMEMRETMWEKEDNQSLKSKMRERVRPKMGRIDIDYQKLHDAFFKWQTKPPMTRMGELYYEGKELEAQMKEKKPGILSDELRIALGMPVGPNCTKFPPPWLIAMQRYGPPPSYPNLKIPGLNSGIPEGCAFGYHAGGWGKPPVDEYGKPLYGDVFGIEIRQTNEIEDESRIERRHWGEIGSDEEESEEEESDIEEDEGAKVVPPPESGYVTPATTEGFATPSGITTIPGVETPDSIELRKKKAATDSIAGGDTPGALYTILPEKKRKMPVPADGVEISLNPDELDMADQRGLEQKYEEQLRKQNRMRMENEEDFSELVAEHSAKQNRKRKVPETKKTSGGGASSQTKKYKDFKF